ncbi:MAG: hypothetical protein WBD73_07950 [Candidatus Acidiferrales bacterium]
MKQTHCVFEERTAAAGRSGEWSDALLAHLAGCRSCAEVALVASYVCSSNGAVDLDVELPDAGRIWRKAQVASNVEVLEKALRPIVWARRFAFGFGAAVLLVTLVAWWPRLGGFVGTLAEPWAHRRAAPSAGNDSFPLLITAIFLLILLPLIFGLYAAWSED